MTTAILDSEIVYRRETRDYDILICGQIVAGAANFFEAEAIRTRLLTERRDEGAYATATELDADPWDDGPSQEEQAEAAARWTECEGGWEQYTPHPFDPSRTARLFQPRLFAADPPGEPSPIPTEGDDIETLPVLGCVNWSE